MTIYLAGPITGLSYDEAVERRRLVETTLRNAGFTVRSPMRGKEFLCGVQQLGPNGYTGTNSAQAIFRRDTDDVLNSDVVLIDLTGAKQISVGTMFELGVAWTARAYIVLVMEQGNVHEHLFLDQAASIRFEIPESAVRWLTEVYAA